MSLSGKIGNNLLLSSLKRTAGLLTAKERLRSYVIGIYTLVAVLVDVAGLALAIPVMLAAAEPKLVKDPGPIHDFKEFMGATSYGSYMVLLAALLLLVFIVKNSITLLANYLQSRYAYDIATNLARRQFIKYYNRGYTYFKDTNSADIANNVLNIPVFFVSGILVSLINFFSEAAVLILIVVTIAVTDIKLFGALVVVLVPTSAAIYALTKNRLYSLGQRQLRLGMSTMHRINQAIFGYVDVRLTNKENYFLDAYLKEQVHMNETLKAKHVINLVPTRALEAIAVLGILVIFSHSYLTSTTETVVFQFVASFAVAAFRMLPSLNRCLTAIMTIKGSLSFLEVLEEGSLPTEMERMVKRPLTFEKSIAFKDVSFWFAGAAGRAVDKMSFEVNKGEKIGIIGESGSGKTTLMNLLLRFLQENEGGIYIDGHKLDNDDIAGWRDKVGYVQQNVFLIDDSLRQNVAFGQHPEEIDEARLLSALEQASLLDFVKSLPAGLDTPVGEMGGRLSGGQRQRIGIARALYYQSQVLVFDEATSALDTDTENAITESIQSLQKGMTVFVVAHRYTTLRNCDRIIELKEGKLVNVMTYPELVHEKMLK